MDSVPYRAWVDYVELLVVKFRGQPRHVLDLACGTGNVGLELARRGFQVTGVDRSAGMLAEARRKAQAEGLAAEFLQQDMTALDLPPKFDLCVCLYDSLNYILEPEGLQRAFHGVAGVLRPQGLFIFDLNTEFALAMNLFTQRDLDPQTEVKYDWYSEYDSATHLCRVQMKFYVAEEGRLREFQEVHLERAYGLEEVQRMLRQAGFTPLALYDAFSFKKPRNTSDRVYFVARRE
jgi:ubiquinone/menaquinone biosynthesis C-methylase UbiE